MATTESEFTHVREMVKRHTAPGALGIYLLFAILFLPSLWDAAWGEPWVDNQITVFKTTDNKYLIEDVIITNAPINGDRQITIESSPDNTVLCSSRWSGAWEATSKRNWALRALAGNCEPPNGAFRVCSRFSIYSQSGRHRTFPAFCSAETILDNPVEKTE